MNILPVLDLLKGHAVHAVGGKRHDYQPLKSAGCQTACPLEISRHIRQQYGLNDWYIADLDGIVHRRWNLGLIDRLVQSGLQLRVDCGIQDAEDLFAIAPVIDNCQCIVATEALLHQSVFDALTGMIDPQKLIFSLDLIDGELNSPPAAWGALMLPEIIEHVLDRGVREVIVLDLAYVGCDRGLGTLGCCQDLKARFPELKLITGGGVRTAEHFQQLEQAGVDTVLLGSCLHQAELPDEVLQCYLQQQ